MSAVDRHIEIEDAPDRAVYLNGERMTFYDGGIDHVITATELDGHHVRVIVGMHGDRIEVSARVFRFPNPDPIEHMELDHDENAERPTFKGDTEAGELLVEIIEVQD